MGLLALGGCSTLADTFNPAGSADYLGRPGPNILGGTRLDGHHIADPDCKTLALVFFFLDMPLSFALDAVFLPYTIISTLATSGQRGPETRR